MKGFGIAILVIVFFILITFFSVIGVWNNLNTKLQTVKGAESGYSSALNVCSEKIKGVWEIANQYMDHESKTFTEVAKARSGYQAAVDAFEKASKNKDIKALTQSGQEVVQAAMAFRIQIEAYPQLRAVETSKENIRNLEEAVNEIKTSLDDWITTIKDYNTYRGSAGVSMVGGFMTKYPIELEYYKGKVESLNIEDLNPEKEKK